MANLKNLIGGIPGMALPMGAVFTTQVSATDAFTSPVYPGIALFGDDGSPHAWTLSDNFSNGTALMTTAAISCIKYLLNDGYFNDGASDTIPKPSARPTMNLFCDQTGQPYRILQVISDTEIIVDDPLGLISSGNFWYARSEFYPNKRVNFVFESLPTIFTLGGGSFNPYFNGAVYKYEAGNGVDPIDIIGCDTTATFTNVIK